MSCRTMDRDRKILLLLIFTSLIVPAILIVAMFTWAMDAIDIGIQALFLCIMVPIIALSAYMWATGKGAMLIAGYNTSPRSVRDMYDSRALTKYTGKVVTISMVIMLLAMESIIIFRKMIVFWALLIASIVILMAGILYMNKSKRFLKEGVTSAEPLMTPEDRKLNRNVTIVGLVVTAIIIIAVIAFMGSGSVSVTLGDDDLQVKAPLANVDIPYQDIESVEYRENFDTGRRIGGFGGTEICSGNFQNDEFGKYKLASHTSVPDHIIVHYSGGVLAFNLDTAENTQQTYEELLSRVSYDGAR